MSGILKCLIFGVILTVIFSDQLKKRILRLNLCKVISEILNMINQYILLKTNLLFSKMSNEKQTHFCTKRSKLDYILGQFIIIFASKQKGGSR